MVDYIMTEWQARQRAPNLMLIDSTGPAYDWRRQPLKAIWRQPLYCTRAFFQVAFAIKRGKVAALHVHMGDRGSVVRKGLFIYLAAFLKHPVIVHMHAAAFPEFYEALPRLAQTWVRQMLRLADRFIVLGRAQQRFFVESLQLAQENIVVLQNAIPAYPPGPPRLDNDRCDLLFIGTLIARKGLDVLLKALAMPTVKALRWRLRIAGEGDQAAWRRLAGDLGLINRVDFLGWVPSRKVHELLDDSDMLVVPSLNEGLPVVILEAMAHARPVIATPVGSVGEAVEHDVTGLIVPPADEHALASALARLISHPSARTRFGAEARRVFEARFTVAAMNARLEGIFSDVRRPETRRA